MDLDAAYLRCQKLNLGISGMENCTTLRALNPYVPIHDCTHTSSSGGRQVVGIWFYDSTECDKVVALLDRIGTMDPHMAAQSSAGYSPIPAILPPTSNPQYLKASRGPHSNDTNVNFHPFLSQSGP